MKEKKIMSNIEMQRKIKNEELVEKSIRINEGERDNKVYFSKQKRK